MPDTLASAWPILAPMLARVVERGHGEYTLRDVAVRVASEAWQLWTVVDSEQPVAAVVTELVQYPAKKIARVIMLGGQDFTRWKHLISTLEDWALYHDCVELEAWCRPGMARKVEGIGFAPQHIMMVKSLRSRLH